MESYISKKKIACEDIIKIGQKLTPIVHTVHMVLLPTVSGIVGVM